MSRLAIFVVAALVPLALACGGGGAAVDAGADALPVPPLDDGAPEANPPVACGTSTCQPGTYDDVIALGACCTAQQTCGLDLSPLANVTTVPTTCTPLAQPGTASGECPTFTASADGGGTVFDGCCRPDNTCGVFVKLGALDLGCAAAADFVPDAGAAGACGLDASPE
jgi:hypothetical protein